jgi:UDP-2,3-diacylglucosamine pyrophosphatase LpxH
LPSINNIHRSLDKLHYKSPTLSLDLSKDKWIIFSDHHRGVGDGADDFAICKNTYLNALDYYLAQDYGLILLGDVEEFWENTLKSVISKYKDVLQVEKKFHDKKKLIKVWGNHDDAWNHLTKVKSHLFPFFNDIAMYEGLNLNIDESINGSLLLVHGHQGSGASDKFAGISRWFVRVFWRNFQRLFKFPLSTPAVSKELKDKHDIAMHTWAKNKSKQLIICGHTHQPVFMSKNHLDILERELEGLDDSIDSQKERIQEIHLKIASLRRKTTAIGTLVSDNKPCYFNTGCCSYADGDITGLELVDGSIKLIKWADQKRTTIDSEKLVDIFELL